MSKNNIDRTEVSEISKFVFNRSDFCFVVLGEAVPVNGSGIEAI